MGFGQVGRILLVVSLLGWGESFGEENARSTRTLGSFFSRGGDKQQVEQQQQNVQQVQQQQAYVNPYERPLVYQVKYYDTVLRDVNKNNIDKAGEVRQEIGQQRVYYYTTSGVSEQVRQPGVQVPQGYVYVNPVVGGGQPQAYIVGQVGDQQVLVPCPVDYVYQTPSVTPPVVDPKVVPIKPAVVQPIVQQNQVKGRDQPVIYNQQVNREVQQNARPVGVGVGPEVVYNPYQYYGNYGGYQPYVNPYIGSQYTVGVGGSYVGGQYVGGQYLGGVGYNYPSVYNPVVSSDTQQVVVLPSSSVVSSQGSTNVPVQVSTSQQGVGVNPYVYIYRGGVSPGYNSYVYPYVPVGSYVRPKENQGVEGSSSTRVSVSAQGQQVVPVQVQQQQQKQQQADSRTSTTKN